MSAFHDDGEDSERPRKRRIIESEEDDVIRAVLHEEMDIEIGVRQRLRETVESRLTWALILQDTLEKHFQQSGKCRDKDGPNEFADLAIAAYHATNGSSELFFPIDAARPLALADNQAALSRPIEPSKSPVQETYRTRPTTRPHVQLHHEDRAVKEPNRFLYLRDLTATPTMVYKVACPDCHRSDFPRLQGLLNHCRLKHHREFGSHDECVQACAVVVPEEDQAFVIEHGLEVLGMSASLQRLFKMAVGSFEGIVAAPKAEEAQEPAEVVQARSLVKSEEDEGEELPFVTKTLGYHKDTPALAPFLGRAPKKRQVHVYDEERPIDIVHVDNDVTTRNWRMPYRERGHISEGTGSETLEDERGNSLDTEVNPKPILKTFDGSRFHIPIRLIVNDYSLRVPDEESKQTNHCGAAETHKWMISVSTASYSLHVSTVLAKMSVTGAPEPSPSSFRSPLSVSEPPFCIMGTSNASFLARITLEWVGTRNKPTQLEHWVQLHEGKSTRPVKGDEQILDIELDRHTEVIPQRNETWKVDWSITTSGAAKSVAQREPGSDTANKIEQEPIRRLKRLLQRFPMTAQDAGSRKVPEVPYFLPVTTHHFLSLTEGRRRAIEWGRARAIWDAFEGTAPEHGGETQGNQSSDTLMNLSGPGDVYRWMKQEGYFICDTSKTEASSNPYKRLPDVFCGVCGFLPSAHRKGKSGRMKDAEEGALGRLCEQPSWIGKMPIVDVRDFLAHQPQAVRRHNVTELLTRDAIAQVLHNLDPTLIFGVRRVVSMLRLPCFLLPEVPIASGTISTKEQREAELAPYAVLAASVSRLIRLLVCGSIQTMEIKSESSAKHVGSQLNGSYGPKRRLLTPVHVVRGLLEGAKRKGSRQIHRALLLSLARTGIAVHDVEPPPTHTDAVVQELRL